MNEVYVILDGHGHVIESFDSFTAAFKFVIEELITSDDFEDSLDQGILCITIMKVRRNKFKILREVKITIHDEIKRKEVESHGSTEDHSCNDLFKEW